MTSLCLLFLYLWTLFPPLSILSSTITACVYSYLIAESIPSRDPPHCLMLIYKEASLFFPRCLGTHRKDLQSPVVRKHPSSTKKRKSHSKGIPISCWAILKTFSRVPLSVWEICLLTGVTTNCALPEPGSATVTDYIWTRISRVDLIKSW